MSGWFLHTCDSNMLEYLDIHLEFCLASATIREMSVSIALVAKIFTDLLQETLARNTPLGITKVVTATDLPALPTLLAHMALSSIHFFLSNTTGHCFLITP